MATTCQNSLNGVCALICFYPFLTFCWLSVLLSSPSPLFPPLWCYPRLPPSLFDLSAFARRSMDVLAMTAVQLKQQHWSHPLQWDNREGCLSSRHEREGFCCFFVFFKEPVCFQDLSGFGLCADWARVSSGLGHKTLKDTEKTNMSLLSQHGYSVPLQRDADKTEDKRGQMGGAME